MLNSIKKKKVKFMKVFSLALSFLLMVSMCSVSAIADTEHKNNAIRLEAEIYGSAVNYASIEKSNIHSNGFAYYLGQYSYSKIPTQEDYFSGNYNNQPYVIYEVEAETDGIYSLSSGYKFGTGGVYPDEIHTYIIVTDGNNNTVTYQQNGLGDWVDVRLTKGKNTVVTTIFDRETYYMTRGAGQGTTWLNMDYLDVYTTAFEDISASGLEYGIRPVETNVFKPVDSTNYTRFEAETDAFYDGFSRTYKSDYFSNSLARMVAPDLELYAQTKSQIESNGIDTLVTPTLTYYVTVESAGNREIINGLYCEFVGTALPQDGEVYVAVSVNGEVQINEIAISEVKKNQYINLVNDFDFSVGTNKIQITCATADSILSDGTASVNIYPDCIDIKDTKAKAISSLNRIEAEDSLFYGYSVLENRGTNYKYVGNENLSKLRENSLTFDKLNANPDYLTSASFVEYTLVAEKEGYYPILFAGWTGDRGMPANEIFAAISINGEAFEKINIRCHSFSYTQFSRTIDVYLKKGVNRIVITGALADFGTSVGYSRYIEQDYIAIPNNISTQAPQTLILGDVTDNKEVDLLDLLRYKTYFATQKVSIRYVNADIDCDGKCDITDIVDLKQILLEQ